jgi:type IV pilus secretin pilQ
MKTNSLKKLSVFGLGLMMQAAFAGNITDVNVSVLPDQQRVIKLKFDRDPVEPSGFITSSPARIALDFRNTGVKLAQSALTFNDALLNQVVAAQNDANTRVLLGLTKDAQYNAQIRGNEVWIYVSESASTNTAATNAGVVAGARNAYVPTASASGFNIDFRKASQNAGVVEFSSAHGGQPQIKAQNDRIVVTLKNYALPTQEQRNLDVTDFSTPVKAITVKRLGNDTQIVIRNQGTWQHKVTENNGRFAIQVLPKRNVAEASVLSGRPKAQNFTGKRISLDFQNVDVRTVLQVLAKESGMNIVASDSVQGKMTLSLKDVPWDQALDLVLDARNLAMRKHGNIINIAPRQELREKDLEEAKGRQEMEQLGPLLSQSFQLKYKNVEEFKNILRLSDNGSTNGDNSKTILSPRGSALIDPATNTLIITDIQTVIQKFQRLIEELDVPAKQVMVEARIVEAADGVARDLGVKFGANRRGSTSWGGNWNNGIEANRRYAGRGTGSGSNGGLDFTPNVNLPISSATSSIAVIRSWASGALGLELSAMETDNLTKTISTPRVLTQDRKEAEIRQGTQIPYTMRDVNGVITTSFKDAILSLKVTPRITPDAKIILDITINKDEPDYSRVNVEGEPGITTRAVKTQAMIEDGGTLVVGGIYQEQMSNNISKVPFLGDIPVLGNLFKSRSRSHTRNELLFFITPRIMGGESTVLRY